MLKYIFFSFTNTIMYVLTFIVNYDVVSTCNITVHGKRLDQYIESKHLTLIMIFTSKNFFTFDFLAKHPRTKIQPY